MKNNICLGSLEYAVTKEGKTEPPFNNKYWNNKKEGLYLDVISGVPLFCSTHKFDSGSGWPSFFDCIDEERLVFVRDTSHGMERVEVRSKSSDSHLGHIFDDGPMPTGKRYCINSAALTFVEKKEIEAMGLGEYLILFGP